MLKRKVSRKAEPKIHLQLKLAVAKTLESLGYEANSILSSDIKK
jgi:hypothetical protein